MQKQKKATLTESQVKLKKLITPIVEGILNENKGISKPINSFLSSARLTDKIKSAPTAKFEEIYDADVDPKNFGVFALIISELSINVKVGKEPTGRIHLNIGFKYTHTHGGSNGYDLRVKSSDNGKTWEF